MVASTVCCTVDAFSLLAIQRCDEGDTRPEHAGALRQSHSVCPMSNLQTRRYVVAGRVQGVGFRWFVEREAALEDTLLQTGLADQRIKPAFPCAVDRRLYGDSHAVAGGWRA